MYIVTVPYIVERTLVFSPNKRFADIFAQPSREFVCIVNRKNIYIYIYIYTHILRLAKLATTKYYYWNESISSCDEIEDKKDDDKIPLVVIIVNTSFSRCIPVCKRAVDDSVDPASYRHTATTENRLRNGNRLFISNCNSYCDRIIYSLQLEPVIKKLCNDGRQYWICK